jgi:hypothetical protein
MTKQDTETLEELSQALWGATVWRVTLSVKNSFEKDNSSQNMDALCLDFHVPMGVQKRLGNTNAWDHYGSGTAPELA